MDIVSKIGELYKKTAFLIDIFPHTITQKYNDHCFEIEEYFKNNKADINKKFRNILIKLYYYYDFIISIDDEIFENPELDEFINCINRCFEYQLISRDYINIVLPECNSMIILNGDYLNLILYNPDEKLKKLASDLAISEGLFFYSMK